MGIFCFCLFKRDSFPLFLKTIFLRIQDLRNSFRMFWNKKYLETKFFLKNKERRRQNYFLFNRYRKGTFSNKKNQSKEEKKIPIPSSFISSSTRLSFVYDVAFFLNFFGCKIYLSVGLVTLLIIAFWIFSWSHRSEILNNRNIGVFLELYLITGSRFMMATLTLINEN